MRRRLFVAIPLPDKFLSALSPLRNVLSLPGIRWIPDENLHITVHFIGYVDSSAVDEVSSALKEAIDDTKPFRVSFSKIEFGPPGRSPRMVWAVFTDPNNGYLQLSRSVYSALKSFSDSAPYKKPIVHVTLARFDGGSISRDVKLKQPEIKEGELNISRVCLMESKLLKSGAIYGEVERYSLR